MSAGTLTKGTRVETTAELYVDDVKPGSYCLAKKEDGSVDLWIVDPTGSLGRVTSSIWTIEEHGDGTVTVSPSILAHPIPALNDPGWHGYLERGVWREV